MAELNKEIISGQISRITFHNPTNGYTVARVQVPGQKEPITAVGKMPGVAEGQSVRLCGAPLIHPKFGPQWEVSEIELLPPDNADGVTRYFGSGLIKGVGPKLAKRLVDHLGIKVLDIIQEQPERLAAVPGIGPKKAVSIASSIRAHGQLREVMVFLQEHGVGVNTSLRIWRQYGPDTLTYLKTEPHRLAQDVRGIGFITADSIAQRIGLSHDHPSRLQAGIFHTLSKALEEGHVYLPYHELMEQAAELLSIDRASLGPALVNLKQSGLLTQVETEEFPLIYLTAMLNLEEKAARHLIQIAKRPGLLTEDRIEKAIQWVEAQIDFKPSETQVKALAKLFKSGLSVLTGGPGTGKTTLVRALVAIALRMGLEVVLAAPTGRAAKRLSESCDMNAVTLHRLLDYSPKDNSFQRNAGRPLSADLVVIDESSMIDIWLMAHLAEALPVNARLVLVGDVNQLPSVGAGLVLNQIINSRKVAVAHLDEIYRQAQSSLIVHNAHRILHGNLPLTEASADYKSDFFFIDQEDSSKAADLIRRLVAKRLPAQFGYDSHKDIQVLAPMHRGTLGCSQLNQILRQALNPQSGDTKFAAGDKVMQVRNNYDLEVFNGDIGIITESGEDGASLNLGDRTIHYSLMDMDDLTLAYAITIHKSQGSEYPAVIVALAKEHFIMLNRSLLYTAVTRGKQMVLVVGHRQALKRAVDNHEVALRYARLDANMNKFY